MFNKGVVVWAVLFSVPLWSQAPSNSSASDLSQEAFVLEHWNESVRFENDGGEKTGAKDRARHMYALAAATRGPESQGSRQLVTKLNSAGAEKELSQATVELEKMRTIALPALISGEASAHFILLFDNSSTPDRVQFLDGDDSLRSASEKLQAMEFPIKFPDVSSIKIIRMGTVSCRSSGCKFELQPLKSMQESVHLQVAGDPK